jgi:biopolymer transport protein ExbB/TolQ
MSPMPQQPQRTKTAVPNNLYTAILAVALGVVIATVAYVAYWCQTQYQNGIFGMPGS